MIGSRLGLTPDDLETLALALCATRGEHPEGMQYGGLWRPEGVTCAGACAVADRERLLRTLPDLRGRDLMCWCPPNQPCHADVLIEMANAPLRCEGADV